MNKIEFYSRAVSNLGLFHTVNLEKEKRFGRDRPMRLTSKRLDHPVSARRGSSDLAVFHQIFSLREYRILDQLELRGLIVDLGANVGYSSAYFLSQFPSCNVVAVEPYGPNFEEMTMNLAPYGSRLTAIQAAIMPGADQVMPIAEAGEEWGATVTACDDGGVRTISIPEILKLSGQDQISLLKIDIEGAEKQLFEADTSWLDQVENIAIELHGEECRKAFFAKINPKRFDVTTCDELTICVAVNRYKYGTWRTA